MVQKYIHQVRVASWTKRDRSKNWNSKMTTEWEKVHFVAVLTLSFAKVGLKVITCMLWHTGEIHSSGCKVHCLEIFRNKSLPIFLLSWNCKARWSSKLLLVSVEASWVVKLLGAPQRSSGRKGYDDGVLSTQQLALFWLGKRCTPKEG